MDNGVGYLDRTNWQLPTTQSLTAGCFSTGPHGESFGYECTGSAIGSLYSGLGLIAPDSAAGPVSGSVTLNSVTFNNLQPNYYWSDTSGGGNGFHTFSFATGWRGSNIGANVDPTKNPSANFFYLLPMLNG